MASIDVGAIFLEDNYSIEHLLSKGINLNELRDRLVRHQQVLNQTSLELFNNSYDRFYKLSHIISCLAEPIQRLTDPLQTFRDQLHELCQNHDNYIGEINNKLSSLEETCRNKELAKQLILLTKRRDRIDKQLENIDWSIRPINQREQADRGVDFLVKCDLLERIIIQLYHLLSEVRAIQPTHDELITIKNLLESSLDHRQCQLDTWFEGILLESIELQDKTLISFILRTYQQTGGIHRLYEVRSNKDVKPYSTPTETHSPEQVGQEQIDLMAYEPSNQFLKRQLSRVWANIAKIV